MLKAGHVQVVDADLKKFFDKIPHEALMRSIARRVIDGRSTSKLSWLLFLAHA